MIHLKIFCSDVISGMDVASLQDILVFKVFRWSLIRNVSHEMMTYQTNGTLCGVTLTLSTPGYWEVVISPGGVLRTGTSENTQNGPDHHFFY